MNTPNVDASCAICGAPPEPECYHEAQRLRLALDQAQVRWNGVEEIREWVLNHARVKIINTFQELKRSRIEAHFAYLECLPCYTVYKHWNGNPPIDHTQLMILKTEISRANDIFKRGLDEDWRRSCMRYPEVLDYYFSLIRFTIPREDDPLMRNPRFGQQKKIVHTRVRSTDRGRRRR